MKPLYSVCQGAAFLLLVNSAFTACSITLRENPGESGRVTGKLIKLDSNQVGIVGRATSTDRLTFPKSVQYRVLGLPDSGVFVSPKNGKVSFLYVVEENHGKMPWGIVIRAYSD